MKIALGCDHRGGKIAYQLTKNVFLRAHYHNDTQSETGTEQMIGAFLLEGATFSDDFNAEDNGEEAGVYRIKYGKPFTAEESKLLCEEHPIVEKQGEKPYCVDYPDVAAAVAQAVSEGVVEKGVLICGTGIGMCITANKFRGVRAAVCYNEVAAELSRLHNDANILCISAEFLSISAIEALVRKWFATPFEGGRHIARLQKIADCELETGL